MTAPTSFLLPMETTIVPAAPQAMDAESGHSGVDPTSDPAIAGGINLPVDLADDQKVRDVRGHEKIGGENIAVE